MSSIILALNTPDLGLADQIVSECRPYIGMIKIGSPLFLTAGDAALDLSGRYNIPMFLDMKIHEYPSVTSKVTEILCEKLSRYQGTHFLSVDCFSGTNSIEAATKVTKGSNIKIVGSTLMTTSPDSRFLRGSPSTTTQTQVNLNKKFTDHFTVGATHLSILKRDNSKSILIAAGIRSSNGNNHDHLRMKTASFAAKNGADWIIIGRPITESLDYARMADYFENQIEKVKI